MIWKNIIQKEITQKCRLPTFYTLGIGYLDQKKTKKTESNVYFLAQDRRKNPRPGRTKRRNAPQIKSLKRNKNIYLCFGAKLKKNHLGRPKPSTPPCTSGTRHTRPPYDASPATTTTTAVRVAAPSVVGLVEMPEPPFFHRLKRLS